MQDYHQLFYKKYLMDVSRRIFDITLLFPGITFFLLTFPLFAFSIKISSKGGPVFYSQRRIGRYGKPFMCLKYRTLPSTIVSLKHMDIDNYSNAYITKVGYFLRKTHLDEVPQLLNILDGTMSFVGPRPEWEKFATKYQQNIPDYKKRYSVKPGLTGWAQVNYKASNTVPEAQKKLVYDLYYIENMSIFLDIKILIMTLRKIL